MWTDLDVVPDSLFYCVSRVLVLSILTLTSSVDGTGLGPLLSLSLPNECFERACMRRSGH